MNLLLELLINKLILNYLKLLIPVKLKDAAAIGSRMVSILGNQQCKG